MVTPMVDVMGHLAMGLLWAAPAWFIWSRKVSLAFIGLVVSTSPLPDVDLWIERVAPATVHHHGVTHTVVFVVLVSLVAGAIVAAVFARPLERRFESDRFDTMRVFAFAVGGLLLGGLSHLFADMLSAPDIAQPIAPFWPFIDKPWSVDLIWYDSPVWNVGFLAAVVLLHVVLAYIATPVERPYRAAQR